ncbi:MAG TPA: hypothetical protein VG738_24670 [Chitinophagaceae bacterium]|nr:hypothetical protein [Chitinophagaceae bacterium]
MGLDTVELVVEIEKTFDISIANDIAAKVTTVADFYNVVEKYVEEGNNYTREEIVRAVNSIVANFTRLPLDEITPGKRICEDLGLD